MAIKSIQKIIFFLFSLLFIAVVLTSCGDYDITAPSSGNQGTVSHDGANLNVDFPAPRFLTFSSSVDNSLRAQATIVDINDKNPNPLPNLLNVDPLTDQISGTIKGVRSGTYNLGITYFIPTFPNDLVLRS